jgi:hypothetical protein
MTSTIGGRTQTLLRTALQSSMSFIRGTSKSATIESGNPEQTISGASRPSLADKNSKPAVPGSACNRRS